MAQIDEIARDLYRICIPVPELDMQFNHFLVKDEEPLLFHTGTRQMFPAMWDAVGRLIDPASLRCPACEKPPPDGGRPDETSRGATA